MRGPKAIPTFHGILAVGNTKNEAVNQYRLLAQGKGVSAMVDEGNTVAFVTHASSKIAEMFNPLTAELDLNKNEEILGKLEFEAQAGEIEATHYVCESGCGLHLVYDSEHLVQHCPVCTTAIASDDEEETDEEEVDAEDEDLEDDLDEEENDEEEDDSEDESEDEESDEEGDDEESDEEIEDEESDEEDSEEDDSEEDDSEDEESDEESDEEEEDDSGEPLVIAADSKEKAIDIYRQNRQGIATAATTVEVEYLVCSSAECNAHVISEEADLSECPACASALIQPQEETAAPEATETQVAKAGDEEEEDSDLEVIPDEDEEESEDDEESDEETSESNDATTSKETDMNVEKVSVDMLTQIKTDGENSHQGLDLSFSASVAGQPVWTAFYNGTPVAIASKADAGKNADIFEHPAFGNAVIAGAKHVGVKETLTEMGFKGIAHEIAISTVIADKVEAQVAQAQDELARDRKEHAERLMAALATSAIGINRGFFADVKNPIKAQLWNALSSAGVKNAEVLIDNAFRGASDAYHTALFAKASEIIDQPLEVQESLSKAVLGANYMGVSESSSGATGASIEDRLENFGTNTVTASAANANVKAEQKTEVTQESLSSDARISSVVANLGRRGR